jgi:hypothetical protein
MKKDNREKVALTLNGPRFLLLKSKLVLDLSVRLYTCEQALRSYDDIPDIIEGTDYSMIVSDAAKDCKTFEPTTNDKIDDKASRNDAMKTLKKGQLCKIHDKGSLRELSICCVILGDFYSSASDLDTRVIDKYITTVNRLCDAIIGKSHEAIGYWTAKLEEKKRNMEGGAKKKSEKGKKNQDGIKHILSELKITSLSVFRNDKKLRAEFYEKCKKATDLDSEDRISKIARALLRG